MILPPTLFLKAVRVFGSVCFVVGSLTFFVCATGLSRKDLQMGYRIQGTVSPH
jgi:hypothetical protein